MSNVFTIRTSRAQGVLVSRLFAYVVDLIIIGALSLLAGFFIFILGFFTFGLAWGLFAVLPGIGILYSAVTVGGPLQSTLGMRLSGLKVVHTSGARVDGLTAAIHALFFYVAAGTGLLLVLDIVVALLNENRRMLHDFLAGLAVVRN